MKRKEFLEQIKLSDYHSCNNWHKLYNCKAYMKEVNINDRDYILLRSYETIVAVYSHRTATVYAFGWYSNTTRQHIYKFCEFIDAMRLTKLFIDSTCEYQVNFERGRRINAFREVPETLREIKARDYDGLIETI